MEDKYNSLLKSKLIDPYNSLYLLASKKNIIVDIKDARKLINEKFIYYTSICKIIQNCYREYIKKINYIDKLSRNYDSTVNYINSETFLGIEIEDINPNYFYCMNENGISYAFDIREIYNHIKMNKIPKNPYTNKP